MLKGFRPGKVPTEILKRQFGKAVFGEVIDKVLKETTTKALPGQQNKTCRTAKNRFKILAKIKDLEYVISVTELPKLNIKSFENITFEEYSVKIEDKEIDKRIDQIAKTQNKFKDTDDKYVAKNETQLLSIMRRLLMKKNSKEM